MDKFLEGLNTVAYLNGYLMQDPRQLEDGYTEVVFTDKNDPEVEISIDFKEAGEFNGSNMLGVRYFKEDNTQVVFFISAIPYVLFGALVNEV